MQKFRISSPVAPNDADLLDAARLLHLAVGTAAATVADAVDGWVYLHMEYEDESWDYYFQNRSDYDMWLRAVSPDGWLEPNTVLKNKVG